VFNAVLNAYYRGTMNIKSFSFMAAAALLVSIWLDVSVTFWVAPGVT
jgi:hypothetical protein